jgi:hypothetical protein
LNWSHYLSVNQYITECFINLKSWIHLKDVHFYKLFL